MGDYTLQLPSCFAQPEILKILVLNLYHDDLETMYKSSKYKQFIESSHILKLLSERDKIPFIPASFENYLFNSKLRDVNQRNKLGLNEFQQIEISINQDDVVLYIWK